MIPSPLPRLIAGLGNPRMENTRHNAGMDFVNFMAKKYQVTFTKIPGIHCEIARIEHPRMESITLLKPTTFMNDNGKPIAQYIRSLNIPLTNLLVAHDDMQKKCGAFMLKRGGSSLGHNGVESCYACLQQQDFWRLRFGIGRPLVDTGPMSITPFVLGVRTPKENELIKEAFSEMIRLYETETDRAKEAERQKYLKERAAIKNANRLKLKQQQSQKQQEASIVLNGPSSSSLPSDLSSPSTPSTTSSTASVTATSSH